MLKECSGTFCVGDSVTLADCYLIPQVYNANRFGIDMNQYPIISRICRKLEQIEAFQKAHPSTQPDAVI